LFTAASSDKSPGDSLLFKQSALRGVSYALTKNGCAGLVIFARSGAREAG
jgi:hypothetical protein